MNHRRRGVALIFNHIHFNNMSTRKGAPKDCEDMEKALIKLDFEVRVYSDPGIKTISKTLQSAAAEDHTDADCLIVVAMSHGESGLLHSADSLYPVDMLWTPFTADRCLSLAGKPKLFFIQACRGARLDKGVKIMHETDSKGTTYSIPAYADIMVAYSTYDESSRCITEVYTTGQRSIYNGATRHGTLSVLGILAGSIVDPLLVITICWIRACCSLPNNGD